MLTSMGKPVAKVLTMALFAVLILSFAVWGIGDIFSGGGAAYNVAEVGDTEIGQREFSTSLNREMNRLQANLGMRLDIEQAQTFGVVNQVLQQLVNRALFDEQARRLGMIVSEDTIRQRIAEEPAFHNQFDKFDPTRFIQVLRANNMSEEQFIASMTRDITRQQIASAVTAGAAAPETLAKTFYRYIEERRVAETIAVPLAAMAEPQDPDEETLSAFYDENSDSFMKPETRSVTLIQLRAEDLAAEIAVSEDDLMAAYDQRRDDFSVPEERELEQIVLPDQEAAERAKKEIDAGTDFATVAESETGATPISLGGLTKSALASQFPELADIAFATPEGGVSEVVESPFGWHLIHVLEVLPGSQQPFEEVRDELQHDFRMRQAVDSMISIANQLDDELAGGATLEEAADLLDLAVTRLPAVDDSGNDADGNAIDELPPLDEFLTVLRETAPGEESLLTETQDGNYFLLRVDGTAPASARALADVRDAVIEQWKATERDRLAREKAESLAARANEGFELSALTDEEGLTYAKRPALTRDAEGATSPDARQLAAQLFAMKRGDVASFPAGDAYLVAKLVDIDEPDPASDPATVESLRQQLTANLEADVLDQFANALRQDFGVVINAPLIEEILTTSAY